MALSSNDTKQKIVASALAVAVTVAAFFLSDFRQVTIALENGGEKIVQLASPSEVAALDVDAKGAKND